MLHNSCWSRVSLSPYKAATHLFFSLQRACLKSIVLSQLEFSLGCAIRFKFSLPWRQIVLSSGCDKIFIIGNWKCSWSRSRSSGWISPPLMSTPFKEGLIYCRPAPCWILFASSTAVFAEDTSTLTPVFIDYYPRLIYLLAYMEMKPQFQTSLVLRLQYSEAV